MFKKKLNKKTNILLKNKKIYVVTKHNLYKKRENNIRNTHSNLWHKTVYQLKTTHNYKNRTNIINI